MRSLFALILCSITCLSANQEIIRLFSAIANNDLSEVKVCLRKDPLLVNERNDKGLTPCEYAHMQNHIRIENYFVRHWHCPKPMTFIAAGTTERQVAVFFY